MSSEPQHEASRGLLEFDVEQQCFQIGEVQIGGQPGARPRHRADRQHVLPRA